MAEEAEKVGPSTVNDDDSSSEDDLYENYLEKYVPKYTSVKKIEEKYRTAVHTRPPPKPPTVQVVESDDEDSLLAEEAEDIFSTFKKDAEKYKKDTERKMEANERALQKLVEVDDTKEEPEKVYVNATLNKIQESLRTMKESIARVENDDVEVIAEPSARRKSDVIVSLLVKDLINGGNDLQPYIYSDPLLNIANSLATKWNCNAKEVLLTVDGEAVDPSKSPQDLGLAVYNVHTVTAIRMALSSEEAKEEVEEEDPGLINLKIQMQDKKSVLRVHRKRSFNDIREMVRREFNVKRVNRMVFDDEEIDDGLTPDDLEMEDDDCVDVFAE